MKSKEERVDEYYDLSARELAEMVVDTEDELEMWKQQALRLKGLLDA